MRSTSLSMVLGMPTTAMFSPRLRHSCGEREDGVGWLYYICIIYKYILCIRASGTPVKSGVVILGKEGVRVVSYV